MIEAYHLYWPTVVPQLRLDGADQDNLLEILLFLF